MALKEEEEDGEWGCWDLGGMGRGIAISWDGLHEEEENERKEEENNERGLSSMGGGLLSVGWLVSVGRGRGGEEEVVVRVREQRGELSRRRRLSRSLGTKEEGGEGGEDVGGGREGTRWQWGEGGQDADMGEADASHQRLWLDLYIGIFIEFIPCSFIEKEASHVEGCIPELALESNVMLSVG
ncbi:hypothetical protein MUK42_10412 [Musa troglodytarum]|uniref:Uncharacterized protein n=1 Tax=Musa troglodytarum TaxID=320322 RepID=A0A9E7KBM1_9LILI|nr:hypothetical protein MUK42_10412 [Musa troglodytarum]